MERAADGVVVELAAVGRLLSERIADNCQKQHFCTRLDVLGGRVSGRCWRGFVFAQLGMSTHFKIRYWDISIARMLFLM